MVNFYVVQNSEFAVVVWGELEILSLNHVIN